MPEPMTYAPGPGDSSLFDDPRRPPNEIPRAVCGRFDIVGCEKREGRNRRCNCRESFFRQRRGWGEEREGLRAGGEAASEALVTGCPLSYVTVMSAIRRLRESARGVVMMGGMSLFSSGLVGIPA